MKPNAAHTLLEEIYRSLLRRSLVPETVHLTRSSSNPPDISAASTISPRTKRIAAAAKLKLPSFASDTICFVPHAQIKLPARQLGTTTMMAWEQDTEENVIENKK